MTPEFRGWPKIPRWQNEEFIITEKLDGTNGCVVITEDGEIFAQSRSRILDETKLGDNHGFCKWVMGNKDELLKLGPGYHYGEWWGKGINRGYNLEEKRFSLFNIWMDEIPECVYKVPVINMHISEAVPFLNNEGSIAAPGYMKPEGLVMASKVHRGIRYKYYIHE